MIKLIVLDVDGTLTDGGLIYSSNNIEAKRFSTKDAAGIMAAQSMGIDCMVLTGRKSKAVERRCKDLQIKYIIQGVNNKYSYLSDYIMDNGLKSEDILYIGDDLNDLKAMGLCAYIGCPADAAEEVVEKANYVSQKNGGDGAVREIIFIYLKQNGLYKNSIQRAYGGT